MKYLAATILFPLFLNLVFSVEGFKESNDKPNSFREKSITPKAPYSVQALKDMVEFSFSDDDGDTESDSDEDELDWVKVDNYNTPKTPELIEVELEDPKDEAKMNVVASKTGLFDRFYNWLSNRNKPSFSPPSTPVPDYGNFENIDVGI